MEFLLIGVATAFNLMIIKWKLEHKRWADAVLDVFLLVILGFLFAGTFSGLVVATISSAFISLFLIAFPPKLPNFANTLKTIF